MKLKYQRIKEYIQYLEKTKQEELLNNLTKYYNQELYDSLIETEYNTMLFIHIMDEVNRYCNNTGEEITNNEEITRILKIIIPSSVMTETEPIPDDTVEPKVNTITGTDETSSVYYTIRETKTDGSTKDTGYYTSYIQAEHVLSKYKNTLKEYLTIVKEYPPNQVNEELNKYSIVEI